ncbi:MAG: hypothetical protein K8R87_05790 [Verrucomicrobia bacterium]|nr:hypothetical protein [Verrucomicrobiota bacterium]
MKLRPVMLAVVLAGSIILLLFEKGSNHWNSAEAWFLDFLVANVREQIENAELAPVENVVFIDFNEKDKAEFSAWPPEPIDYIIALRKLKSHEPDVLAFSDVLKWDQRDPQFVDQLQQLLVGFNQVALAFSATTGATAESGLVSDDKEVPSIASVEGDSTAAPKLSRLNFPDARLSRQMQLGFVATRLDKPEDIPSLLVGRAEGKLVPSLAAQMIALQTHAPYVTQRLRFGLGAGLYLGSDRFIPLAQDGTVHPRLKGDVIRVSALDLLSPELGDSASQALSDKLGKNKLIILGMSPSPGESHARLAAWALSLPLLKQAPDFVIWIVTLITALLAGWQLRYGRWGAVIFFLSAIAALLGFALVVFESSLHWCPPLLPGAVLLAGTIFCVIWPRKREV